MFVLRAHSDIIHDCLDAFIVGARKTLDLNPIPNRFSLRQSHSKTRCNISFIANIASEIRRKYINLENGMYIYGTRFSNEVKKLESCMMKYMQSFTVIESNI